MAVNRPLLRTLFVGTAFVALSACDEPFDFDLDLRNLGDGFDTSDAVRNVTADRPSPDNRGIISYPGYQVAVARRGDTIEDVAARVGLPASELSRYNGIPAGTTLRMDEVVALPRRVSEPSPETGAITSGPILPANQVDVATIAGDAINRSGETVTTPSEADIAKARAQTGKEPIRHKIERGETAYSIARLYNVSVRALADWNGLGTDLSLREGQYLLIPVAEETPPRAATATAVPGAGSTAPEPPSAASPLPAENATAAAPAAPASPDLGNQRTAASGSSKLQMPVNGKIIRGFEKKKNDGIDIAAAAGTPVKAAADGTVAAITRDTDQVPILVLRHADNLLTVYAGVDAVSVKKGDKVSRGQTIAKIRNANPSFLHFEVRQGFDSVDPVQFLN